VKTVKRDVPSSKNDPLPNIAVLSHEFESVQSETVTGEGENDPQETEGFDLLDDECTPERLLVSTSFFKFVVNYFLITEFNHHRIGNKKNFD
jgi:hypothetical protein